MNHLVGMSCSSQKQRHRPCSSCKYWLSGCRTGSMLRIHFQRELFHSCAILALAHPVWLDGDNRPKITTTVYTQRTRAYLSPEMCSKASPFTLCVLGPLSLYALGGVFARRCVCVLNRSKPCATVRNRSCEVMLRTFRGAFGGDLC